MKANLNYESPSGFIKEQGMLTIDALGWEGLHEATTFSRPKYMRSGKLKVHSSECRIIT